MRKITKEAVQAFALGEAFAKDNTTVAVDGDNVSLALHGHIIAKRRANHGEKSVTICMCGWPTATTRERLHGLLSNLGLSIGQTQGVQVWRANGLPAGAKWKGYDGLRVDPSTTYRVNWDAGTIETVEA